MGIVTFNNPERHNAMSLEMWEAAERSLDAFAADNRRARRRAAPAPATRPSSPAPTSRKFGSERSTLEAQSRTTTRSTAATFASIDEFPQADGRDDPRLLHRRRARARVVLRLAHLRRTIRSLRMPAAKLGLGYGPAGLKRLVDIVGPSFAKEIFYTARQFDAREAYAMGLVNRVVPAAEFESDGEGSHRHDLRQRSAHHRSGEIYRRRNSQGRKRPRLARADEMVEACFDEPRLHRGPHGFHGETQAGVYRELTAAAMFAGRRSIVAAQQRRQHLGHRCFRSAAGIFGAPGDKAVRPHDNRAGWRQAVEFGEAAFRVADIGFLPVDTIDVERKLQIGGCGARGIAPGAALWRGQQAEILAEQIERG